MSSGREQGWGAEAGEGPSADPQIYGRKAQPTSRDFVQPH